MVTTYHPSTNRAFSNPHFWEFVRNMENRDTSGYQPVLPGEDQEQTPEMPTTNDEKTVVEEATPLKAGKAQFPKFRQRLAAKGLSEEDIAARIEKRRAHKNNVATFPMLRKRLAGKGLSEEEIEARIVKRQAQNNDTNRFPKLRQRLAEKGFSEEQINERVEKCRVRRATALSNKIASNEQIQASADESKGQMSTEKSGRRGPRAFANRRVAAGPTQPDTAEKNVATEQNTADDTPNATVTGNTRGEGFVVYPGRRLQDITKGGYPKFAPYFAKKGANPSNGNSTQTLVPEEKTSASELNKDMDRLNVNDSDDSESDGHAKKKFKKMNKKNQRMGHFKGKGNKNLPRADVFQTNGAYFIHAAVPGAKPEDVAVTWDPEMSAVRVAGIIRRADPQSLGSDGALIRGQRFVGPFDRKIKLGKKKEAIKVYENGLTAVLADGILNIEVPKYDGDSEDFVEVNEKV